MRFFLVSLVVVSSVLLTACSQTSTPASPVLIEPADMTGENFSLEVGDTIEIENFVYQPSSLVVKPGAVVTVINRDNVEHTLTSSTEGGFDTGLIGQDLSATFTAPTEPGIYPFYCVPHPEMTGVLIVE